MKIRSTSKVRSTNQKYQRLRVKSTDQNVDEKLVQLIKILINILKVRFTDQKFDQQINILTDQKLELQIKIR